MSNLLTAKSAADILNPTPRKFECAGETFEIKPMPDSTLMHIGDALSDISGLFDTLANTNGDLKAQDMLSFGPQIIRILIPNSTRLIAGCLRRDEAWVAENVSLAKKLEALRLIVETEDIPLLLKNWEALVGTFRPLTATTPKEA